MRYQAWAGIGNPDVIKSFFDGTPRPNIDAIWPIVDSEHCGGINGYPDLSQFFCVAFSSVSQQKITDALNEYDKMMKHGKEQPK